jgi:phosphoglycerate dehydrogenase-like enzyme
MKKVVLSHRLYEAGMKVLEDKVDIRITNTGKPEGMLPELLDADGLIIRIGSIDRETMMAAKNLKVIGRPGVGVDDVDVTAATELGIPVVVAPGANTRSVAEHTLMLILAEALKNNIIQGAGLDVFAMEPLAAGNPWADLDNVIITPHMAALTREAAALPPS